MSGLINYAGFDLKDTPSLTSKVAVVTGGNAGIGAEIVAQFLLHDIEKVYVLARSKEKYEKSRGEWKERGLKEERTEFVECDLSDLVGVKKVGDELVRKLRKEGGDGEGRLDVLVNNAGLPTIPDYTLSPQGIETIWATNVVGPYVLTNILLPLLESTAQKHGNSRVVVTSSSFHMGCQELKLDSTMSETRIKSPDALDSCWRYARSKLGNILFTKELAKRLSKRGSENVYANCFFPGNVPTEAMDTWKSLFGTIPGATVKGFFQYMGQSVEQAAATAVYLSASPEVEAKGQKGKYFIPIATEDKTSKLAEDKDLAKNLWYWCDFHATKALGKGWDEVTEE